MSLNWRLGVLYAAVIGIEGCWLYAIMALLNRRTAADRLAIFGILLLFLISFGLNILLRRIRCPAFFLHIISWIAWVAAMLLVVKVQLFSSMAWSNTDWLLAVPQAITEMIYTFKPELLILISSAFIWWFGSRLVYRKVGFATLLSEFQFGLFILVIIFLIASLLKVTIDHTIYLIIVFFLISLLGISIAHALENTSWLSGLYQGHWSGLLLTSVSLVIVIGFLISLIVTPDLLQLFIEALKWIWDLILRVLTFIASLLPESEMDEPPPPMPAMPGGEAEETTRFFTIPEPLRNGLRISWAVIMIGVFIFALWRVSSEIFKWLRRRLSGMAGGEYEQMPGAFKADLLAFLKSILYKVLGLRRLFQRRARAKRLRPEIATVRQVYRQFLKWAAGNGFPRHYSQTPHEYLNKMEGLLPDAQGDLAFITQQYVRTRYGTALSTEDELHKLRQSWYNVKQNRLKDRRHN